MKKLNVLNIISFLCLFDGTQRSFPFDIEPLAITHATIVDVQRGNLIQDQTILIYDNKIESIGETGQVKVPAGSKIINASGKFLIPGLWDAHVHLSSLGACTLPVLVAYGITSVRDLGSILSEIDTWQTVMKEGKLVGPRIKAAGYTIESGGWLDAAERILASSKELRKYNIFALTPRLRVDDESDAKKAVDSLIRMGSDFVKFRNLGGHNFFALARECERRGMLLVGHAPQGVSLGAASNAGLASIEHGETISNSLLNSDMKTREGEFKILARNGTMLTPTLIADYRSKLSSPAVMEIVIGDTNGTVDPRNKLISNRLRSIWQFAYDSRYLNESEDWESFFRRSALDLREAYKCNVPMLVGTDLGVILVYPGSSVHEEMALMAEKLSMSPASVLRAATVNPARFFNMLGSLGTIEPGKLADLVLLDGNPLSDIKNTQLINGVIANGKYFEKQALNELLRQAQSNIKEQKACVN
jgi:imidazolonepropionase-like amidohydrolase